MSIIIILLPGAPKISESFIEQDNLFQLVLRERIKGNVSLLQIFFVY